MLPYLFLIVVALVSTDLYGGTTIPHFWDMTLLLIFVAHVLLLGIWVSHSLAKIGLRLGALILLVALYANLDTRNRSESILGERWAFFSALLLIVFCVPLVVRVVFQIVQREGIRFRVIDLLVLTASISVLASWVRDAMLYEGMYDFIFYITYVPYFCALPLATLAFIWYRPAIACYKRRSAIIAIALFVSFLLSVMLEALPGLVNLNQLVEVIWANLIILIPFTLVLLWILLWSFALTYERKSLCQQRRESRQQVALHPLAKIIKD